jgi:CRP-like cAMP-binding protein
VSVSKVSVLSQGLASRLKAERDEEILRLRRAGWTHRALATQFGLSRIRVIRICARREAAAA